MNKYSKFFHTVCNLLIYLTVSFSLFSQEKENSVFIEAQSKLPSFLEKIPIGNESNYGFENRADFNNAVLLSPINVMFPSIVYYNSNSVDTTQSNYYTSENWEVPISVDNKICCFLRARYIDGKAEVFGIGGKRLAENINNLENTVFRNMKRNLLVFNDIKKLYIIFYNNELNYTRSQCISLDDPYESGNDNPNLFETLSICKNISNNKKFSYE